MVYSLGALCELSAQFLVNTFIFLKCLASNLCLWFIVPWLQFKIQNKINDQNIQHPPFLKIIQILFDLLFNFISMGPSPSQNKLQQQQNESQALVINHQRFNNVKVVTLPSEDDQGAIEIVIPLPNENQFKKWQSQLSSLKQGENIFLPIKQKFDKTEFCGSGGLATITYKYYPYLLRDEVVNRCNMEGKFFEEGELWYLVYSIISAAQSFHAKGEKIGDIRPQNVFISPQGQVRVATQYSWPGQSTNYLKTIFQKEATYLSPQQLKDLNYGKLEQSANFILNQSFSIGLTCLDAATLFDCSKLYEPNNKFNYNKLEERIQELEASGNYTQPLVLLIKGLCQVQGEKRISCKELIDWLVKYQTQIIELQEFAIKEVPEKLHRLNQPKNIKPQFIPQQQQNIVSNTPPANYISAPNNQQSVIRTNNPPPQFLPQYNTSFTVNNNGVTVPRPPTYDPSQRQVSSNFTYKNQILQAREGSKLGGNIDLSHIDQQLFNSRKQFPS